MRGFGGTSAPEDATAYSLLHVVGDMVELVRALKETQAVIVGHDLGAPVVWIRDDKGQLVAQGRVRLLCVDEDRAIG